jgi:hypothetical protein
MFNIEVRFQGGLTSAQQAVFETASTRWSQIIVGDLPAVRLNNEVIDNVVIEALGTRIDGPLGILGQAGPRFLRPNTFLPALGNMEFDIDDLSRLEADGSLENVIIHEMGHVLGIGTIWQQLGLLANAGQINPIFIGMNAMREFATLIGGRTPTPVPVENTGGAGTRDGHWRERIFGLELMTGFLNADVNPLSRLTVASLQDMGYEVNFDAADPYAIPSRLEVLMLGITGEPNYNQCKMCGHRRRGVRPVVLPESALV